MEIELPRLQLNNLKKYIQEYKEYSKTEDYKRSIEDRQKRKEFYQKFTPSKIKKMDKYEFTQFISKLWASRMFTNKEYRVKEIIESNGFEKVKEGLTELLHGKGKLEKRYENCLKIKYLGPAAVTEILCYVYPKKCGIWNDKAKTALKFLGFHELPLEKYIISAKEYEKFNWTVSKIAEELNKAGFRDADLLFADYFLYYVWRVAKEKEKPEKIKEVKKELTTFDHEEIKEKIYQIGLWLGFDAEKEKTISEGARIDVVWSAKIGNLGMVNYVFEVQKRGGIDSLVLNLQKARNNPTVQKLIIVSNNQQIEKIKKEVEDLSEDFKKALTYWEIEEIQTVYENLSEITEIIDKLNLIQKEF